MAAKRSLRVSRTIAACAAGSVLDDDLFASNAALASSTASTDKEGPCPAGAIGPEASDGAGAGGGGGATETASG